MKQLILVWLSLALFLGLGCETDLGTPASHSSRDGFDSLSTVFGSVGVLNYDLDGPNSEPLRLSRLQDGRGVIMDRRTGMMIIGDDSVSMYRYQDLRTFLSAKSFEPMDFYPEYNVINFAVEDTSGNSFVVNAGPPPNSSLRVAKEIQGIRFETWEEHIRRAYIEFNHDAAFERPSPLARRSPLQREASFVPKRIVGEWMLIECVDDCLLCASTNPTTGWIRWRQGASVLIGLRYLC